MHLTLALSSAHVKFNVSTGPESSGLTMHSKKDVFRPSFLCSFKHALLQSLDFVVTGFSYFNRGREVGGGGGEGDSGFCL